MRSLHLQTDTHLQTQTLTPTQTTEEQVREKGELIKYVEEEVERVKGLFEQREGRMREVRFIEQVCVLCVLSVSVRVKGLFEQREGRAQEVRFIGQVCVCVMCVCLCTRRGCRCCAGS